MARTKTEDTSITDLEDLVTTTAAAEVEDDATSPTVLSGGLPPEFSGKRRKVSISFGEGELGKLAVTLGINGYVVRIKRGEKVAIPEEFIGLLKETQEGVIMADGTRGGETPRFNFIDYGPA